MAYATRTQSRPKNRIKDQGDCSRISPKGIEVAKSTRKYQNTLTTGGKGSGKTITAIRVYQHDISRYGDGVFVVMRKNYTALHRTTKQSFERFFSNALVLEKTDDTWYCVNGNEIWFHCADKERDRDFQKTRGLEVSAIFLDEASESEEELYEIMPTLLRRPAKAIDIWDNGKLIKRKEQRKDLKGYILMASNPVPGMSWIRRHFMDEETRKKDGNHNYIFSTVKDNPWSPPGYEQSAFTNMTGPLLDLYKNGNWFIDESELRIIVSDDLKTVTDIPYPKTIAYAGIDVGLGKPDASVIYVGNSDGEIWQYDRIYEEDTMKQVEWASPVCEAVKAAGGRVFVDAGGIGIGFADRLSQLFPGTIVRVNFGESPEVERGQKQTLHYRDRKAQLYFWARLDIEESARLIRAGEKPKTKIEVNKHLGQELENIYYSNAKGENKIYIEEKPIVKARIGRSPDDAEAYVLCNAARRKVQAISLDSLVPNTSVTRKRKTSITDGYRR